MTDPAGPGPKRPERAGHQTPAPKGLRRRVLAGVKSSGPVPVGPSRARRVAGGAAVLICAAAGLSLVAAIVGGGSGGNSPSPPAGSVRASFVVSGGRAELHLAGMPQPPIGEIYEVWVTHTGEPPSPTDALFTPTAGGTAVVEVPGILRGVRAITVTAEPRGGSAHPTSPVVLQIGLSAPGT